MKATTTILALSALLAATLAAQAAEQPSDKEQCHIRAFYFGNSLTGCTDPQLHSELVKPLGMTWNVKWNMGPGWQLWQHRRLVLLGENLSTDNRGDLTLPDKQRVGAAIVRKNFLESKYDVMVLQPFEQSLSFTADGMWGEKFKAPMDVGDIACAKALIATFLKINPQGRVCIYANWPNIPKTLPVPPDDQLPPWALAMKKRSGNIRSAEFPDRKSFDYEQEWLGKKYLDKNPDKPWLDQVRCQDYHYRLFEEVKKAYPELWTAGRLQMIPVADVWMALHRKAKAGQFDGIQDIVEFYTDIQHSRAGLPRYSAAATFFIILFNQPPHKLNWAAYNDPAIEIYAKDEHHDNGEHFPINEIRAKIVHDSILEVVKDHPYTRYTGVKTVPETLK